MHVTRSDMKQANGDRERGLTLIEMMVALLVLSIALLGMASLQTLALQSYNRAHLTTQANNFAYDIADRMRANRREALQGGYDIELGEEARGHGVAATDLAQWKRMLSEHLPQGDGSVTVAGGRVVIVVRWARRDIYGARAGENRGDDEDTREFRVSTSI